MTDDITKAIKVRQLAIKREARERWLQNFSIEIHMTQGR